MSAGMKAFCVAGLISGICLCVFDWLTSVDGVRQLLGNGDQGIVATFLPFVFATLALCFNAASGYFFALFIRRRSDFSEFNGTVTTFLWVGFVLYDALSSVLGLLGIYSGLTINSWAAMQEAVGKLGAFGALFALLVASLLALSPFITSLFAELIKDQST